MRSGYGVPLPELDGENSYCHLQKPRCQVETDHRQVYPESHGLVVALRPVNA